MEELCLHRQLKPRVRHCITVCIADKNAPLLGNQSCKAADPFLLGWDSWWYIDIRSQDSRPGQHLQLCTMTADSAGTEAYGVQINVHFTAIPSSSSSHNLQFSRVPLISKNSVLKALFLSYQQYKGQLWKSHVFSEEESFTAKHCRWTRQALQSCH